MRTFASKRARLNPAWRDALETGKMTAKVNEILVAYEQERARHLREQMNVDSSQLIDEALKERIDIEQKLKAARENKKKPAKSGKGRRSYVNFDVFEANRIEQRNLKQKGDELDDQIRTFTQNTEKLRREVDSGSANDVGRRFDRECRQFGARLPIYAKKNEIIDAVTSHPVVVIVGETGSGKSTQIAQYLADANLFRLAQSRIICTQPRRIAAKALARKVDDEFSSNGKSNQVGVWVGGHQTVDAHARIVYATDRMLLSACVGGELGMEGFQGCIIVDEAHERSIYTDLLLALLKQNVSQPNSQLKLVITSATIDTDLFQRYFDMCPVLSVSGRAYPVDVVWWSSKEPLPRNYVDAAIKTVCDIHEKKEEGDILVFLTGQAEIEDAVAIMSQNSAVQDCWVLPLHGKLQPDEQQCVFEELPPGYHRKIVFATNIAETSVTIPGVRFVVDAGFAKVATSNRNGGMSCLLTQFISQSSANQRMGRAGRCSPGTCHRLYSEDDYNSMDKQQTPEILRLHLGIAILKLLEAGIGDVRAFDFVQRPSDDAIASAMTTLRFLGAVTEGNRLSNLGENMAKLPTDPRLSKMILYSGDDDYDVVAETIAAASVISVGGNVFYRGTTVEERKKCDEMKVQFADEFGDVASYVKIFAAWERVEGGNREKNRWCVRHCINAKSMRAAKEAAKELRFLAAKIVRKSLVPSSQGNTRANRGVLERVSKLFFLSHHDQVCASSGFVESGYVVPRIDDCTVPIHPGSALLFTGAQPEWLVYRELRQTSRKFIADVVVVSSAWIDLLPDDAIDFEAIERRKLQEDLVRNLHPDLIYKLIGKGGCVIRELQASVAEACQFSYNRSVIVNNVNNDVSVRVRVQRQHVALAKKLVSERVEAIVKPLAEAEEVIGLGRGTRSRVRAGAVTAGVSTKNEFTQLSIYDLSTAVRKEEVIRVLQPFGVLDVVHVPPKSPPVAAAAAVKGTASRNFWGFAMFGDHVNAMHAYETVREIRQDGVAHSLWLEPKDHSGFQVKFVWSPGVSMQQGSVRFRNSDVASAALRAFADRATAPVTSVSYSRKDPTQCSLYFSRCSPDLDERQLEEFFERAGIEQPRETAVFRKENPASKDYDDDIWVLNSLLAGCVGRNFRIFPGIKNKRQRSATADFRSAAEMTTAMETLDGTTGPLGCQKLLASRSYSARLSLKKEVMAIDYVRESVEAEVAALRRELRGYVSPVRQSKTKTWPLMIACDDEREVAIARARILRRVEGESYALTAVENFTSLSCLSDRTIAPILQEIQKRTTTAIVPSHRTETLHIHGSPEDVDTAKHALDELFAAVRVRHINLKGDGLPPGLMQAVFQKYDASAKKLAAVLEIDESQLYVDCRRHRLVVCCSEEKHKKLDVIMRKLESGLSVVRRGLATATAEEEEECGVCFSPIIFPNVYTLLLCGHRYCVECLRSQMEAAVRGKQLPILCCVEECSMPISLIDVKSLLTNEESQAKLWLHSLTHFVEKSGGAFKFCPTPDCRSVFKTSSTAAVFTCLECGSETCTACSNEAHRGITCEEFDLMRKSDDGGLNMWIERTKEGRESKPCSFCKITISKNGGCNYVQCTACKKHLCWRCMAHFSEGTECYHHISNLGH